MYDFFIIYAYFNNILIDVYNNIVSSVIFITHDLSVLYQVATNIIVMYAGKIVEKGPVEKIINNPLHPYTKLAPDDQTKFVWKYTNMKGCLMIRVKGKDT